MTEKRVLTTTEVRYIFTEIANGQGQHGSFLVAFASAVCRADHVNLELLQPATLAIIAKYELYKYLPPEGIPE